MALEQKIRVHFPLIAIKDSGAFIGNTAQWRFEIKVGGRSIGNPNEWFDVRRRGTVTLSRSAWSGEVDVSRVNDFDVEIKVFRRRFGRSDESLGSFLWNTIYPFSQHMKTVANRYCAIMAAIELRARGRYGMHNPLEAFASRDTPGGRVMTTVSGTRVSWRVEACDVRPTPQFTNRWPVRPLLPAGTSQGVSNTSGQQVSPSDPMNKIPNPPFIPILSRSEANNRRCARFEITYYRPSSFPVDQLVWSVGTLSGGGRAAIVGSNRGSSVMVRGIQSGEVLLEIKWGGARVATYRALVGSVKFIRYRAQLLNGPGRSQPRSTPNHVRRQMDIANRFLYQAGVLLIPDDDESTRNRAIRTRRNGVFRIEVPRADTRGFNWARAGRIVAYNYRPGVMNFVYVHSDDSADTLGACRWLPANRDGATIRDRGAPSTSWKAPTGIPPDRAARRVTMRTLSADLRPGHSQLFGMYITNGNGRPSSRRDEQTYAGTVAHELGHMLSLRHRNRNIMSNGRETSGHDGIRWPPQENLMHANNPTSLAQDIDIIQAKALRRSPLVS